MTEVQKEVDAIFAQLTSPSRETFKLFVCALAAGLEMIVSRLSDGNLKIYLSIIQRILKLICDNLPTTVAA